MEMSVHATIRTQQRAIPRLVIDLLLKFGAREHSDNGAVIVYFDKRARKNVAAYAGGLLPKLGEHLSSYLVMSEQRIITVGHRFKRIRQYH